VARAESITGLTPEISYGEAAARILAVRAQELVDHAEGVLDMTDIERVHDMRVAARRLRAALEVFEACFPPKLVRRALAEVRELADALGERRDRDVALASLEEFAANLPAPDRPGIESMVRRLCAEQAAANQALAPYVTADRVGALQERLAELVTATEAEAEGAIEADEDAGLAAEARSNGAGSGASSAEGG
jgi:CHAD domain-containing protein